MISTTTTTDHSSRVYNINNNNNRQPFKKVLIFFKEKVALAVVTVIVAVKAAVAVDVVGREPLHYGIRADRKCSALKIDFSANFHPTHDFFWRGLSQYPKNWKTQK